MFTWSNQRCEGDVILEKLDKAITSPNWSSIFPKTIGIIDVAMGSNQSSLFLFFQGLRKLGKKEFKLESKWFLEDEYLQNVKEEWKPPYFCGKSKGFGKKLNRTRSRLIKWNRVKYERSKNSMDDPLKKIKQMQCCSLSIEKAAKMKNLLSLVLEHYQG
ncbi:hypothetical protein V6N13_148095 [Hibiscus sabdariffa]